MAASMAMRYSIRPDITYDIYLVCLLALPKIMAAEPYHRLGFAHALSWPLRQTATRAAVELRNAPPQSSLPETLRRVIETGHLM